ncbi:hypothetical protein AC094_03750 [Bacteroides fragilis]|uniref:Uncharacterized protein n=1 Tax=Bacteroides fragilis TaxID=817 RepID=A0A853Q3H3_BACFG|nr:hypothetical protein M078_0445 [Bacteroides fragilis str. 2-F-2 \
MLPTNVAQFLINRGFSSFRKGETRVETYFSTFIETCIHHLFEALQKISDIKEYE